MTDVLNRLAAVVGERYAIRDPREMAGYLTEWREILTGESPLVLRPATTDEVSRILAIASETRTVIIPQSGNTGLAGGHLPLPGQPQVIVNLDRMTRIREISAADNTMTVDAGLTLKAAQDAAESVDRLFPLSLASEGSCRIGGNLSTNAGGLAVVAYGNARDLCLGLEVVLADGRVWNGLRKLRKDNTGYDLKNLFIGAEGTLGIITGAVLKLFPKPQGHATAFIAIPSVQAAVDLLALARAASDGRVTSIELLPRNGYEFVLKHFPARDPFTDPSPWYILLELSGAGDLGALMQSILEEAVTHGIATDAVIAQSEAQRRELWAVREYIVETQKKEGGSIKHDVAVPVSALPAFVDEALAAIRRYMPDARPMPYGHVGDGNLHFNVSQPVGMDKAAFHARWHKMNDVVFGVVLKHGGSISAEHGIGQTKTGHMAAIKSAVELDLMRGVKAMLDPLGIMNPGKVLP
jgi:FAD/FMN-containing dehydrogenase